MPRVFAYINHVLDSASSLKQTDVLLYHDTSTFNVIENVNDNEEWLNHPVCMQYLHALAIKMYVCLV